MVQHHADFGALGASVFTGWRQDLGKELGDGDDAGQPIKKAEQFREIVVDIWQTCGSAAFSVSPALLSHEVLQIESLVDVAGDSA